MFKEIKKCRSITTWIHHMPSVVSTAEIILKVSLLKIVDDRRLIDQKIAIREHGEDTQRVQ